MNNSNRILKVALANTHRSHFDYLLNLAENPQQIAIGSRITVPFRKKQLLGVFTGYNNTSNIAQNKLRMITKVIDTESPFTDEIIELCQWAADYYQSSIGEVLHTAMPILLRQGAALEFPGKTYWLLSEDGQQLDLTVLKKAVKQQQALQLLKQNPHGLTTDDCLQQGISRAILTSLQEKNLLVTQQKSLAQVEKEPQFTTNVTLNAEQQLAVETILAKQHQYHCFLLDGITGSGKTEIYLQIIERQLQAGKQTLVLVPEIGLTPQIVTRIEQRFKIPIACLHSGLNDRQRLDAWLMAKAGHAKIIVGTRSAIFTPLANLGLIIIDEEHDTSFKQYDGLRYSARDLAIVRSKLNNVPIILGSATPSLESLHNAQQGKYQLLKLQQRAGNAVPPKLHIIDLRNKQLHEGLSDNLLKSIRVHLDNNNQVLLFINRRGYAPVMLCHGCGWIADCTYCAAHLIVHRSPSYLQCHHCGTMKPLITACPDCQSQQLLPLGMGTERLEKALQELFTQANIVRIDRDNTRRKGAMNALLDSINNGHANILIGTQMLAKGHHFPNVTLVGIIDADSGLFNCDFRAMERLGQLITQVSGRAGRAEKAGEVYLQTHAPDHPLLHLLLANGYHPFATTIMQERQAALLPPFAFLALFRAQAKEKKDAEQFLLSIKKIAEQLKITAINFLGPIAAPLEKKANYYRYQLLVQSSHRQALQQNLKKIMQQLQQIKENPAVRWSLDVDPYDLS